MFISSPRGAVAAWILVLFAALTPALADDLESRYLRILNVIDHADKLNGEGKKDLAQAKYVEARGALLGLQKADPTWNSRMVTFRLNELAQKIAPPAADTFPTATTTPDTRASSGTQLKLLHAGGEPRRPLRLILKAGDTQVVDFTMKMGMEMTMAGTAMPAMNVPAMKIPMSVVVKSVTPEGEIAYEMELGEAEIAATDPASELIASAMKASLGSVKGLSVSGVISSRGYSSGQPMKLPAGAEAQAQQSLEQMQESMMGACAAFPEEPVGVGSRWEFKQSVKSQGMTIQQTTTYELVSLQGDQAELKLAVHQHAARQKMRNAQMPGIEMDMEKLTGTGTGSATVDLTKILPKLATLRINSDMSLGMKVAGQVQSLGMKMDSQITFESK